MAKFGPKMSEIAKFVDNGNKFALPVKALFTGKLGKPVLPVFTNFYRYKFTTLGVSDYSGKRVGYINFLSSSEERALLAYREPGLLDIISQLITNGSFVTT